MTDWVQASSGGVTLTVRVVPRASRNQIVGVDHGALKIKLTAPPVEGAANAALVELIAGWLNVRKSAVTITSGDRSRNKVVRVMGVAAEQVKTRSGQ